MNVSGFISRQAEPNMGIMTILRSWILDLGRHIEEKISNRIPYFSFFGPLSPTNEGLELGFTKGYVLSDVDRILEPTGPRKMVRSITLYGLTFLEEQENAIRHVLNETAILNEYRFKRKAPGKK